MFAGCGPVDQAWCQTLRQTIGLTGRGRASAARMRARVLSPCCSASLAQAAEAGLETVECRYACVVNRNRKTGAELRRVFVHALFRKPLSALAATGSA